MAATLVDAVVDAYLEGVAYYERAERASALTQLEKAYFEAVDQLEVKQSALSKRLEDAGESPNAEARRRDDTRVSTGNQAGDGTDASLERAKAPRSTPMPRCNSPSWIGTSISWDKEMDTLAKEAKKAPTIVPEIDTLKEEVAGDRELVRLLRRQLDEQKLELGAPSRVTLFQSAQGEVGRTGLRGRGCRLGHPSPSSSGSAKAKG